MLCSPGPYCFGKVGGGSPGSGFGFGLGFCFGVGGASGIGGSGIWVAAPGEAIISTYPLGSYSASWGTSFSAPIVAGTVALLLDGGTTPDPAQAAAAIGHGQWISSELGHGRLDIYQAIEAWRLGVP